MARISPRAARGRLGVALWLTAAMLVVAAVAAWIVGEVAARHEGERIDTRLQGSAQSAQAEFDSRLAEAGARAERLAGSRAVQRALADGDHTALAGLATANGDVAFFRRGRLVAGEAESPARRAATVVRPGRGELGRVVVAVPFDEELARRLGRVAALPAGGSLALVRGGDVLAATGASPAGERRSRRAPLLRGTDISVETSAPAQTVDEARNDARLRAFAAALLTLLLPLLAWLVFSLLRARPAAPEPLPRRRAADAAAASERRVREAVALVGEALAASHDPEALLPVILESAIGATAAAGARLVSDGREIVRAGDPDSGGAPLALRLGSEEEPAGLMLLYPPAGTSFDARAGDLAAWLAGQASIALENARLHRAVKRQAVTDELTELANRRRFSETLKLEVRRAERFGHALALVLADLDDFKLVNDRFGHQAGDEVLRRFAAVMRECVRDVDLAARYGGEEFALLLPDTDLEGAGRLAERLAESFDGLVLRDPVHGDLRVTASFGIAAYPEAGSSDELLAAADRALYAAKAAGKNRVMAG